MNSQILIGGTESRFAKYVSTALLIFFALLRTFGTNN